MSKVLLATVLALSLYPQDGALPKNGFILDRKVSQKVTDLVGRVSEYQRVERIKIAAGNVVIEDLTFGRMIIVRTDRKLAWVVDTLDGTYSELSFDAIQARRRVVMDQLIEAKKRVIGTKDEEDLATTLFRLGEIPADTRFSVQKETANAGEQRIVLEGKSANWFEHLVVDKTLVGAVAYFETMSQIGMFPGPVVEQVKLLGGFPVKGTIRFSLFFDLTTSVENITSGKSAELPAGDFELPEKLKKIPLKGFEAEPTRTPEKPKSFEKSFKEDEIDRDKNPLKDQK